MAQRLGGPRELAKTGASELIRHFLSNRAPTTLKAYRADLDAFAGFLEAGSTEDGVGNLLCRGPYYANSLVLNWLQSMREAKLASSTQARRISSLRSLISLARIIGLIDWELEVRAPQVIAVKDVRGPDIDEAGRMLDACRDDLAGSRDKAIILLALTMGLRRSEIASLRIGDYSHAKGMLLIHGKGSRNLWMKLPERTAHALDTWLCLSRGAFCNTQPAEQALSVDVPIFIRLDKGLDPESAPLTACAIYDIVRKAGRAVGLKVWPHALRHAAITTALNATGGDIFKVQRFSRHANAAMVMRYDDASAEQLAGKTSLAISKLLEDDDETC